MVPRNINKRVEEGLHYYYLILVLYTYSTLVRKINPRLVSDFNIE